MPIPQVLATPVVAWLGRHLEENMAVLGANYTDAGGALPGTWRAYLILHLMATFSQGAQRPLCTYMH